MRWSVARSRAVSVLRAKPRAAVIALTLTALTAAGAAWLLWPSPRPEPTPTPGPLQPVSSPTPAPRPMRVVTFREGCATAECHASLPAARVVHAPVSGGTCDVCHEPDAGGHTYPTRRIGAALCTSCHESVSGRGFRHGAMAENDCLTCHDPHGSAQPSLLRAASVEANCLTCHTRTEGSVRHHPFGSGRCDACHDAHGSDGPGLLRAGGGSGHCAECHPSTAKAIATVSHAHRDLKGECLACHEPHASGHGALLNTGTRELCTSCHENIGTMVTGATVSHDAVLKGDQCLTCHDPHASPNQAMLRHDEATVCMGCHDKPVKAADGREIPGLAAPIASARAVHGPVATGDCAMCHSVHGGTHSKLLKQLNPGVVVGVFDVRNYALCFSCHDQALVDPESPAATNFRNGTVNLHGLHLRAGDRSRSCATCHAVHAGERPRLMAERVSYDGSPWMMPLGFELTPTGGSCTTACHESIGYDRIAPVVPRGGVR